MSDGADPPRKRSRNWWKYAFFLTLVAFELTREVAVLATTGGAVPNTRASVFSMDGYVSAQGTWVRTDGGERLVPVTTTIQCTRESGQCLEANTRIMDDDVFAPELDTFAATFTPEAVTYENSRPDCARYTVRIDLRLEQAFAVRERQDNPTNPDCRMLERRITMQLGNGYETYRPTIDGHFVPIIWLLQKIL